MLANRVSKQSSSHRVEGYGQRFQPETIKEKRLLGPSRSVKKLEVLIERHLFGSSCER